jgi:hypothetical protein
VVQFEQFKTVSAPIETIYVMILKPKLLIINNAAIGFAG